MVEGGIVKSGVDGDRDGKASDPGKQGMLDAAEGEPGDRHADDRRRTPVQDRCFEGAQGADNQSGVQVHAAEVEHVLYDGEPDPRREAIDCAIDEKRGVGATNEIEQNERLEDLFDKGCGVGRDEWHSQDKPYGVIHLVGKLQGDGPPDQRQQYQSDAVRLEEIQPLD